MRTHNHPGIDYGSASFKISFVTAIWIMAEFCFGHSLGRCTRKMVSISSPDSELEADSVSEPFSPSDTDDDDDE